MLLPSSSKKVVGGQEAQKKGGPSLMEPFCSICKELLELPVMTECGHTFCEVRYWR